MKTLQEPGSRKQLHPQPLIPSPQSDIKNPYTEMREPTTDSAVAYAVALLSHYGFELRGYTAEELVNLWLRHYPANWVRLGVIEALYQGRYKAVSVEQILAVWARRGQPIFRFNHEFERLISRKLPQSLTTPFNAASTDLSLDVVEYASTSPDITEDSSCGSVATPPELAGSSGIVQQGISSSGVAPDSAAVSTPGASELAATRSSVDLPPLTQKSDRPMLERGNTDLAPTPQQDTLPPTTSAPENLAETPVKPDERLPKALSNTGATPTYDADWSRCEVSKQPIHQFTPPPDASDFYLKLKAVVQQQEEIPPKAMTPIIDEQHSEPPQSGSDES